MNVMTDNEETLKNALARIAELEKENERLLSFAVERTECCDVCPQRNTCVNSEGVCPYAWVLLGNEKETTKEWLKDLIKE